MRMSILNRAERFDIHTSSACPTQQTLSIYYLHHGENGAVPNMQKDLSLKSPLLSLCAFSRYSTMPNKKDKQDIFRCPTFSEVGRKIGSVLSSSRQSSLQEHSPLLVPLDIGQESPARCRLFPRTQRKLADQVTSLRKNLTREKSCRQRALGRTGMQRNHKGGAQKRASPSKNQRRTLSKISAQRKNKDPRTPPIARNKGTKPQKNKKKT